MALLLSPSHSSEISFVDPDDYDVLSSDCFSEPGSEGPIGPVVSLSHGLVHGRPKLPKLNPAHINMSRERQLALHMIGTAQQKMVPPYIANKPPPIGKRSQNRYFNDHHFGNRAATATLEELMEHMNVSVEWKSNFEKLARPENQDIAEAFRSVKEPKHARSNSNVNGSHRAKRNDDWNEAENMFTRMDKRARSILVTAFGSMQDYVGSIEKVIVHFVQWNSAISSEEISPTLLNWLAAPMTIDVVTPMVREARAASSRSRPSKHQETVLVLPLQDSPFHRLLIHAVCQFYGLISKSMVPAATSADNLLGHYNPQLKCKIMRIRRPAKRHHHQGINVSLVSYLEHCYGYNSSEGSSEIESNNEPVNSNNIVDGDDDTNNCEEVEEDNQSDDYCIIERTSVDMLKWHESTS